MGTSVASSNLVAFRTQALAKVFLTGRENVAVTDIGSEHEELDLLCRVVPSPGRVTELVFGVMLRGVPQEIRGGDHAELIMRLLNKNRQLRKYPFPILMLLFSMATDDGYAAWVIEPSIDGSGQPRLILNDDYSVVPANRQSLDKILSDVQDWYAKFYSQITRVR